MLRDDAVKLLSGLIPTELSEALVDEFLVIRQDVATKTLGRSSAGKFVETIAQVLQHIEKGKFDTGKKLDVDRTLRDAESWTKIDDGMRICGARIARSMYALRSKRNILHKGDVDANSYDLAYLHHGAQWLLSDLVRLAEQSSMEVAGRLVSQIQAPVRGLIEDFGEHQLVLEDMSVPDEILILLHHNYPDHIPLRDLAKSMSRRSPGSVRNSAKKLWDSKLVEGGGAKGYKLTQKGFSKAIELIQTHTL
jgi:hypothetical protein